MVFQPPEPILQAISIRWSIEEAIQSSKPFVIKAEQVGRRIEFLEVVIELN